MATTKLVVGAMYSGQGMCTLVESYDGATVTKLMLVDFGAEKDSATAREFTLESLKSKIKSHGKIDVMIISHSDRDHWNLMWELLKKLDNAIKIDTAIFGIGSWENSAEKFKEDVLARVPTKTGIHLLNSAFSDIKDKGAKLNRLDLGWDGVTFNILAASIQVWNVYSGYDKVFSEPNTASIVLRVKFAEKYSVLTGDATGTTLKFINTAMGDYGLSGDCLMMTAPHHGALATLYDSLTELEAFTKLCKPKCSLASAQMRGGFNHPAVCVMATMAKYGGKDAYPGGPHSMVLSFYDTSSCSENTIYKELNKLPAEQARADSSWYTLKSDYNIFTTLLTGSSGINWNFNTAAGGTTSVTTSALKVDFVRGAIVPHLPEAEPDDESTFFVGMPPPSAFRAETAPRGAAVWDWPDRSRDGPFAREVGDDR